MPLLDFFHPPLSTSRHWESFHALWTGAITAQLNQKLPPNYFAETQTHSGPRVEVDVATFTETSTSPASVSGNGVATLTQPQVETDLVVADWIVPALFPDTFEVRIFQTVEGPILIAAIELVSPANKDRLATRQAFAIKSASYLLQGIGLIVVDTVTHPVSNPLQDLVDLLDWPAENIPALAAVSYRPVRGKKQDQIELRIRSLEVGQVLPTLPLALNLQQTVLVDLEAAYEQARQHSRL